MDIQILREFVTLMTYRSGAKASRALNIDPSTLSRHMNALERELGVGLFEHGNKTEFTQAAYAVAPAIVDALKGFDAIFDAVPRDDRPKLQPFRVFCIEHDTLCSDLLSYALRLLSEQHDVKVVEVDDMSDDLYKDLVNGRADAVLGLPVYDGGEGGLDYHLVYEDSLYVWFNKDSDLWDLSRETGTLPIEALAGHVLPVSVDPRLRRGSESSMEALLKADVGIRTEPIFTRSVREYSTHISGNRFFVGGSSMDSHIPKALFSRFGKALIDSEGANANRALSVRAGEQSVPFVRLLAALRESVKYLVDDDVR